MNELCILIQIGIFFFLIHIRYDILHWFSTHTRMAEGLNLFISSAEAP